MGNLREEKIIDMARIIAEMTGSLSSIKSHLLPTDAPKAYCPDITRTRHLLRWEPKVPLEEGLTSTLSYFRGGLGDRKTE